MKCFVTELKFGLIPRIYLPFNSFSLGRDVDLFKLIFILNGNCLSYFH